MMSASSLPDVTGRTSSYSSDNGGACIEIAEGLTGVVPVRDSKDPHGPVLAFSSTAWASFVTAVDQGTFGNV